jgi:hypothetical protein
VRFTIDGDEAWGRFWRLLVRRNDLSHEQAIELLASMIRCLR